MATLHVYSNFHISKQATNIQKGDYIFLEDKLSLKRWHLYFRMNNIDHLSLDLTYLTLEEYLNLSVVFDNIVGNPPYNEGKNGTLWVSFLEKVISMNTKFSFIIPSAILTGTGAGGRLVKIRRKLIECGLYQIDILDPSVFPGASVNTCVIYVDPSYKGDVKVNINNRTTMFDLSDKDYFIIVEDDIGNGILEKMYSAARTTPIKANRGQYSLKGAGVLTPDGKNKILSGVISQRIPKFENTNCTIPDLDKHKVAFKYSPVHANNDFKTLTFGYEQPFYLAPGEFPSEFYSYINVDSKEEAERLIEWLTSDIVSWTLLKTRSQRSRDNTQFFAVPKQPVSLTSEEMRYIQENMQC